MPFLKLPSIRKNSKKDKKTKSSKPKFPLKKGQEESFVGAQGTFKWDYDIGKYRPDATAPKTIACCTQSNNPSVLCCTSCTSEGTTKTLARAVAPLYPPLPVPQPPPSYCSSESEEEPHTVFVGSKTKARRRKNRQQSNLESHNQSPQQTPSRNPPQSKRDLRYENRLLRERHNQLVQQAEAHHSPPKELLDKIHMSSTHIQQSNEEIAYEEQQIAHQQAANQAASSSKRQSPQKQVHFTPTNSYEQQLPAATPAIHPNPNNPLIGMPNPLHAIQGYHPSDWAAESAKYQGSHFQNMMTTDWMPSSISSYNSPHSSVDFQYTDDKPISIPSSTSRSDSRSYVNVVDRSTSQTIREANEALSSLSSAIRSTIQDLMTNVETQINLVNTTATILTEEGVDDNDIIAIATDGLAQTVLNAGNDTIELKNLMGKVADVEDQLEFASADATNTEFEQISTLKARCKREQDKCQQELTNCQLQLQKCREMNNHLTNHAKNLMSTIDELRKQPANASALALANCVRNNRRLNDEKDRLVKQLNRCQQELRLASSTPQDQERIRQLSTALQQSAALEADNITHVPIHSTPAVHTGKTAVGVEALLQLQKRSPIVDSRFTTSTSSSSTTNSPVIPKTPPKADPATQPIAFMHEQTIAGLGIGEQPEQVNPRQFINDTKSIPEFTGDGPDSSIIKWLHAVENACTLGGYIPSVRAGILFNKTGGAPD